MSIGTLGITFLSVKSYPTVPSEVLEIPKVSHLIPNLIVHRFVLSHCTMGRIGQNGDIPMHPMQYALSLLSVPSHCNTGQIGENGDVPNCLLQNALFLLSVMGGIAWNTSNPPVLSLCVLSIPSYCTVDGLRTTGTPYRRAVWH